MVERCYFCAATTALALVAVTLLGVTATWWLCARCRANWGGSL